MSGGSSKPYVIGYEEEHERLERQARIGRIDKHLEKFSCRANASVLDAGCGSGSMSRLLANAAPNGHVVGVDTNDDYLQNARRIAEADGLKNVEFKTGDIFALPFDDDSFDLVWCKYVFQWVNNPSLAIREFCRVTRPGGKIVCCNFDGFGVTHYPVDTKLREDSERFFHHVVDPFVGRKTHAMFRENGLIDIKVDFEPDATFTVCGPIDEERRANWVDQLTAAFPAAVTVFGSEEKAQSFIDRFLAHHEDPDTSTLCTLYFVEGTVPE
ncbi:MAG: methyltransferase domain-containing protein [Chloroflexota bacterium]